MFKPLAGMRVLDFSRVLAGPLCAQYLGDLGADVIKVETVGDGDESRTWPPFHNGMATAYITANRNKKSMAVNLKHPDAAEIVARLVRDCDIVVESAATGVSQRLGVDYDTLSAINDKLIYCTISGFGRTGPMKDARGYDMILQAYSGMMSVTGDAASGAIRIPFSPIDQATGYHAVIGVLSAVIERGRSGKGRFMEVSLYETAASFLGFMVQAYLETGTLPQRSGSGHAGIAPYQAFDCADKPVLVGVANDKLWRLFCAEFGRPELARDPRFLRNRDRVLNRTEVVAIVQELVGALPSAEVLQKLLANGIPCAPINTFQDLLKDPQATHRAMIQTITGEGFDGMKAVAMPILFGGAERSIGTAPPRLGAHTAEIMARLGYDAATIERMQADGAIGCLDTAAAAVS